jgi:hypothetical protein
VFNIGILLLGFVAIILLPSRSSALVWEHSRIDQGLAVVLSSYIYIILITFLYIARCITVKTWFRYVAHASPDSTTAKFFARNCVCEIRIGCTWVILYWIFPLFAFAVNRTDFYSLVNQDGIAFDDNRAWSLSLVFWCWTYHEHLKIKCLLTCFLTRQWQLQFIILPLIHAKLGSSIVVIS